MPGFVIDRRDEHKNKSPTSRDRFLKRYKDVIKKAAADTVQKAKGFKELTTGKDGKEHEITIDRKSLDEPQFQHGIGGETEYVLGGNDRWDVGDTMPKPRGGAGKGGREGSPDGDGEDTFTFYLSREEFINLILDDLALPDMVKKNLAYSLIAEYTHAGFTRQGSPGNMDVGRTFKQSISRRIGLRRNAKKARLVELEEQLIALVDDHSDQISEEERENAIESLKAKISALKAVMRALPFIDPNMDLRFRHRELERKPSVSAAMFCLMDVSGSMTENMKMHAKYFFMLLHLFLKKNYTHVDVIFVRHTSHAEEVDEETFFYDRETGGTVVSSGLDKIVEIIKQRYDPAVWNIYLAQASDGDNYGADSARCVDILENFLLPLLQYMVYVEMSDGAMNYFNTHGSSMKSNTDLWRVYEKVAEKHEKFRMQTVGSKSEIYPVFRRLFEKKAEHT